MADGGASSPEPPPTTEFDEEDIFETDFTNFVDSQIERLIAEERTKSPKMTRLDELEVAVRYCRNFLVDTNAQPDHDKRTKVMAKLVELKLEQDQVQERIQRGEMIDQIWKHRGHEFVLQSTSGRNPYCEICLSTIWRVAQQWRKCKVCNLRTHDKCISEVKRPCVGLKTRRENFRLNLRLCPESGLLAQIYKCAECLSPIGFGKGPEFEPRICDYTGKYYCKKCHWNDEMIIPARVVRNWDCTRRPVCRASKQLLLLVEGKPIINLNRDNPALFRYVTALQRMQKLRNSVMLMKCYFLCCRNARKLRILQYLNRYQHFVESEDLYSLSDLVRIAQGTILPEVEQIVKIFRDHITRECEICQGNGFICELCDDDKVIFPFDDNVSICKNCFASFHKPCYDRKSKRCPRCARRKSRHAALALKEDDEAEEIMEECADEDVPVQPDSIVLAVSLNDHTEILSSNAAELESQPLTP